MTGSAQLRSSIRTQLTSYTLSTAQTGFTARPWVHALRVKACDWGRKKPCTVRLRLHMTFGRPTCALRVQLAQTITDLASLLVRVNAHHVQGKLLRGARAYAFNSRSTNLLLLMYAVTLATLAPRAEDLPSLITNCVVVLSRALRCATDIAYGLQKTPARWRQTCCYPWHRVDLYGEPLLNKIYSHRFLFQLRQTVL